MLNSNTENGLSATRTLHRTDVAGANVAGSQNGLLGVGSTKPAPNSHLQSIQIFAPGRIESKTDGSMPTEACKTRLQSQSGKSKRQEKEAILRGLNSQLHVKAQKIRLKDRGDGFDFSETDEGERVSIVKPGYSEPEAHENKSRIPKLTARQRRRDSQPIRAGNKIANYRPGYTWNRGGRLKELRIRTTARKFYYQWKRKVFGNILPSEAKSYYERRLKKECFYEWYDLWWVARKEWRLNMRAELHNRYRLWHKTWAIWRGYTLERRVKTRKKTLADEHANSILLQNTFAGWLAYVHMRNEKEEKTKRADLHHDQNLQRLAWEVWMKQHRKAQEKVHIEETALQIWAHNLTQKCWVTWRVSYLMRRREVQKDEMAGDYHQTALKIKCFSHWKKYTAKRRQKCKNYAYATRVHRLLLLKRYLGVWQNQYEQSVAISVYEQAIDDISRKARCRRALNHWKHYILMQREMQENEELADEYYLYHLQRLGFKMWRLYVTQQKVRAMKWDKACRFYDTMLQRRYFKHWEGKVDEREEILLQSKTNIARQHYNSVIADKMIERWKKYTVWRKHRLSQYAFADAYYITQTLPHVFARWREFVVLMQKKREIAEQACEFRRESLLVKHFYRWHHEYTISCDTRMMERMAILHYDVTVTKSTFNLWRKRATVVRAENVKLEEAGFHYNRCLCRRMLNTWLAKITGKKEGFMNERKAAHHHRKTIKTKVWNAWKQYIATRRIKNTKKRIADGHYGQKAIRRAVYAWKSYHAWWKNVLKYADTQMEAKNKMILRERLHQWHTNAQTHKLESLKMSLADEHLAAKVLKTVFSAWRHWAALHAHKKYDIALKVEAAQIVLRKGVLKRTFARWQSARDDALLWRLKYGQAEEHYNNLLLGRVIRQWKACIRTTLRKKLLMRQCMWFHNTRITAKFFIRWRVAYSEAQETNSKTNVALWHWSLVLERKVLASWFAYVLERRRKKERYNDALVRRRQRLVRDGTVQWLQVAADLTHIRQKFAIERGAEDFVKNQRIVQRCASHWRHLTLKRKQERGGAPPPPRANQPRRAPTINRRHEQTFVPPPVTSHDTIIQKPTVAGSSLPSVSNTFKPAHKHGAIFEGLPRSGREKPRKPSFLLESLRREGLHKSTVGHEQLYRVPIPSSEQAPNELWWPEKDTPISQHKVSFELDQPPVMTSSGQIGQSAHTTSRLKSTPRSDTSTGFTPDFSANQHSDRIHTDLNERVKVPPLYLEHQGSESTYSIVSGTPRSTPRSEVTTRSDATPRSGSDNTPRSEDTFFTSKSNKDTIESQPRPLPPPSLTSTTGSIPPHSQNMDFMFTSESENEGASGKNNPLNRVHLQQKCALKPGAQFTLLPPTAFMTKIDGTPIEETISHRGIHGTSDTDRSSEKERSKSSKSAQNNRRREKKTTPVVLTNSADELVSIRQRLATYKEKRDKLKNLKEQDRHLSEWIAEQSTTDSDVIAVKEELVNIQEEMTDLRNDIEKEKPNVRGLVERVQQLVPST